MNKRKLPCLILSVWLSFALLFQILGVCLSAHADLNVPDWAFAYDIFETTYEERLEEIRARDGYLAQIINDPDIPLVDKRNALVSNALVTFDYKFAIENFQRWEIDDFTNVPDTVTVSGSGGGGVYRLSADGELKYCDLYSIDAKTEDNVYLMASSPDFEIICTLRRATTITPYYYVSPDTINPHFYIGGHYDGVRDGVVQSWHDNKGFLRDYSINYGEFVASNFANGAYYNTIPVITSSTAINGVLCGLGSSFTAPVATIDSTKPWEYYNNTLMPYILDNYSSDYYNIRDLLPFPYGYTPSIPEPTEPLTAPNGGLTINNNWNIGINIIYPTDASGQPVTDDSGETVTETEYVTETYPPDGEYNFQIPTLERLRIYDATLPEINLTAFADGFSFIWIVTENIFTRSGFMPVVLACLGLGVVCYIIWKVGG